VFAYPTRKGEKRVGIAPLDKEPADSIMLAFFAKMRRIGCPAIFDELARRMVAGVADGRCLARRASASRPL
jgi:hypothetical protein